MSLRDQAQAAYLRREKERQRRDADAKQQRKNSAQIDLGKWCERMGIDTVPRVSDEVQISGASLTSRITSGYPFSIDGINFYCDFKNGLVVYVDGHFDTVVDSMETLGELLNKDANKG